MKVLQLAYKVPFPQHDGGSYSIFNSANTMLEAGMNVKTLAMNTPKDWVETAGVYTDFQRDTRFEWVYTDTRIKPGRALLNLLKKESYFTERFFSHAFEQKLMKVLLRNRFDVVVLEHLYLCQYIEAIRAYTDAKIILRAQNVEHRIWEKFLTGVKNPFKKTFLKIATRRLKAYECQVVRELDGIIALTTEDAAFFNYKAPHIPVMEIPVGFSDSVYTPTVNNMPVLFHLGSMDWLPNVEGIDWFIDHVLPLVVKKYPGIKFHIAGKKMPEWYYRLNNPNLVVDGRISSSKKYMASKDILIVPLLSGGGMRV
ncbi:MAG TPA: glycosyltransferase, partial [Flavobacteriales bacterium]|nr:glycosyltransferase [Flavobacteriales bacterium]